MPAAFAMHHNNSSSSTGSPLLHAQQGQLGVGFSGSSFLIFYFVGVSSILQHLGIISNTTRLAGSSGGSAVAAAACAGVDPAHQFSSLLGLADTCRPSQGCRGYLGTVVSCTPSSPLKLQNAAPAASLQL